ncbi:MAG: ligase-associated DNA damage response endonuclease PdeM [Verrucomicrobiota bacterium]
MECISLQVAGDELVLWADHAIHWPNQAMLIVADIHLGRSQVHRDRGLFLPEGNDQRDLDRLAALLDRTNAKQLLVLGDLFHGQASVEPETLQRLKGWVDQQGVTLALVDGNHDRRSLRKQDIDFVERHGEPLEVGPFLMAHEPCEHPSLYPLCGHLHPGIRYRDGVGCAFRSKAFWLRQQHAILPAFGGTTSFVTLNRDRDDRIFACNGRNIQELAVQAK